MKMKILALLALIGVAFQGNNCTRIIIENVRKGTLRNDFIANRPTIGVRRPRLKSLESTETIPSAMMVGSREKPLEITPDDSVEEIPSVEHSEGAALEVRSVEINDIPSDPEKRKGKCLEMETVALSRVDSISSKSADEEEEDGDSIGLGDESSSESEAGENSRKRSSNPSFADVNSAKIPTYCGECSLECKTAKGLETHAKILHPSRKVFPCTVTGCPSAFTQATNLIKHLNWKHGRQKQRVKKDDVAGNIACRVCGCLFSSMRAVQAHKREEHPKISKESYLRCSFCPATFSQSSSKNRHERSIHCSISVACEYCDKNFVRWDHLRIHEKRCVERKVARANKGEDAIECKECGKIYPRSRAANFRNHKARHKRYFRCPICNWGFSVKRGWDPIKLHARTHHPENYEDFDFEMLFRRFTVRKNDIERSDVNVGNEG